MYTYMCICLAVNHHHVPVYTRTCTYTFHDFAIRVPSHSPQGGAREEAASRARTAVGAGEGHHHCTPDTSDRTDTE